MYSSLSDADLALRLSPQGTSSPMESEKAFAEIYSRFSQRTYAYALRVTGDAEASQDILQEAFIKFYQAAQQAAQQGEPLRNPGGYLMTIARNLSLNFKRDQKPTVDVEELRTLSYTPSYERDELLNLMNAALELLDVEYREAVVLKLYQGMSYDEMAELTGETIPTLKNRVWRGKERMKQALAPVLAEVSNV